VSEGVRIELSTVLVECEHLILGRVHSSPRPLLPTYLPIYTGDHPERTHPTRQNCRAESTTKNTMKAIKIVRPGHAEIQDVPIPTLRDDYVLVKVKAVALNPTDW